ncbi:FAD binding domain-containing protein [Hypoxylon argillaceum]|nr:FAD binding domain-containing protein [Hypoxylon argillaceum]
MPPSKEIVTSDVHNGLGINVIRTWPSIYNGSNNPHGVPSWWAPLEQVDVLIVGAGPSGLAVATSLARQGVSFRIIDKSDAPLAAGKQTPPLRIIDDGAKEDHDSLWTLLTLVLGIETIATFGLEAEISEEGPLIERTAIYKDGEKLVFNRSHQSDSRYRGLHIITQGQIERIYIRDLARHKSIVERSTVLSEYTVRTEPSETYPVQATIKNLYTADTQTVQAKFLIGSDGAASMIRKGLNIPFDGVSTGIYWGIMDCIFVTDYPHAWVFGSVISSNHGGCVIIPREDGYIRLYTQLDISMTGSLAASRQAKDPAFNEAGGKIDIHSITPEEVLEQANKIFSPYKLKFGAPLSWFAIWKISERVARAYSSQDNRVHLVGDAAVHSVMGAFGLNASIIDGANLAWKIGLAAQGRAKTDALLPTYNSERRQHAVKIIEVSGTYLRFVCGSDLHVPDLRNVEDLNERMPKGADGYATNSTENEGRAVNGGNSNGYLTNGRGENGNLYKDSKSTGKVACQKLKESGREESLEFLSNFFKSNGSFLLGVDCPYGKSVIRPEPIESATRPLSVKPGVRGSRTKSARLFCCRTGYLYDKFKIGPAARFHIVVFGSSLCGRQIQNNLRSFADMLRAPKGFYQRFGGASMFNIVLVAKLMPFELGNLPPKATELVDLLRGEAEVVYDDRPPDEDAHTTYGVNHAKGGMVVIRPDLWVGMTAFPDETDRVADYFAGFLV